MIGKGRILDRIYRIERMDAGRGLHRTFSAWVIFWGEFLGRRVGRFAPGWIWGAPLVLVAGGVVGI